MFPIGQLIFVGDEFTISYHLFTYTGLVLLCGLIVTYTGIIVQKLDEIKETINNYYIFKALGKYIVFTRNFVYNRMFL